MIEIANVYAVKVNNILTVAGEKRMSGEEKLKIGSLLSDGENTYEISGFPFVRNNNIESIEKNICVTLKQNDIDANKLNGKTLKLIQN